MSAVTNSEPETHSKAVDSTPQLSPAERAILEASIAKDEGGFPCPNCGSQCLTGELACSNCHMLFAAGGKTHKLDNDEAAGKLELTRNIGEVFVERQQAISFEINGQLLMLPPQQKIIIGRLGTLPGDPNPDVNLNAFDAQDYGVSRQHILITRERDIVYIADLGSSNGTYLNGRGIPPNTKRILRNGDELHLGHLKIQVRFDITRVVT